MSLLFQVVAFEAIAGNRSNSDEFEKVSFIGSDSEFRVPGAAVIFKVKWLHIRVCVPVQSSFSIFC